MAVFRPGNTAVCPLVGGLSMDLRELYDVLSLCGSTKGNCYGGARMEYGRVG